MYDLMIRNGTVVTGAGVFQADVAVRDGRIAAIGRLEGKAKEEVSAEGLLVFPGGVDCHAHLNEPGYTWREDYEHGTKAAAAGGVTTIVDMPLQNTPSLVNTEAFDNKVRVLEGKSYVDYAFWGGLIDSNLDQIEPLARRGVAALKSFISPSSPDYPSTPIPAAYEAMKKAAELDLLLGFHCEDYAMISYWEKQAKEAGKNSWRSYLDARPVIAEELAVQNILDMARETGARIHICHVSHPAVAERVRKARAEGVRVTAETCPHYLIFTEEDVEKNGGLFKCSPPLRKKEDMERLWDYLKDGTLESIVSDHSPAAPYEKSDNLTVWETWGGISGLQTGLQIMYEYGVRRRGLSLELLAKLMGEKAAENFRIPGKGKLEIGYDADIVLFDPKKEWEITPDSLYYLNQISAFCGLKGTGAAAATYVRGKLVYKDGAFYEKQGKLIRYDCQHRMAD